MSSQISVDQNRLKDGVKSAPDVLGIQYEIYVSKMYALSLKSPTEYYAAREKIRLKLTEKLITESFDTIFNLLRYGLIDLTNYTLDQEPHYPTEKCNNFSMSVASTFHTEISEKLMLILFPADFNSIANSSLLAKNATLEIK